MKISQFLKNIITNYPIGHSKSEAALRDLDRALVAERRSRVDILLIIAEEWSLDPLCFDLE